MVCLLQTTVMHEEGEDQLALTPASIRVSTLGLADGVEVAAAATSHRVEGDAAMEVIAGMDTTASTVAIKATMEVEGGSMAEGAAVETGRIELVVFVSTRQRWW